MAETLGINEGNLIEPLGEEVFVVRVPCMKES